MTGRGICLGLRRRESGTVVETLDASATCLIVHANTILRGIPGIKDFFWTSLQVNVNTVSKLHSDNNFVNDSIILVSGKFEGGAFVLDGVDFDLRGKALRFDGSHSHMSRPFSGTRFSIVAFTHMAWDSAAAAEILSLQALGFILPTRGRETSSGTIAQGSEGLRDDFSKSPSVTGTKNANFTNCHRWLTRTLCSPGHQGFCGICGFALIGNEAHLAFDMRIHDGCFDAWAAAALDSLGPPPLRLRLLVIQGMPKPKVLLLFGGGETHDGTLPAMFRARGFDVYNADIAAPDPTDLSDRNNILQICDRARKGEFVGGWLSPPCGKRCRARNIRLKGR